MVRAHDLNIPKKKLRADGTGENKMNGIEILAAQKVATAWTFSWTGFFIMFGIAIGLFVIGGCIAGFVHRDVKLCGAVIGIGVLVSIFFGMLIGYDVKEPTKYETQYKITISDEVPMNEFLERYEIISQEGKIYTVREKEVIEDGKLRIG